MYCDDSIAFNSTIIMQTGIDVLVVGTFLSVNDSIFKKKYVHTSCNTFIVFVESYALKINFLIIVIQNTINVLFKINQVLGKKKKKLDKLTILDF